MSGKWTPKLKQDKLLPLTGFQSTPVSDLSKALRDVEATKKGIWDGLDGLVDRHFEAQREAEAIQETHDKILELWKKVLNLRGPLLPYPPPADVLLGGNTNKLEPYVDYSQVHTYNVKRPWVGSANATIKLNSDGTLSEATAEIEDKTLEILAEILPLGISSPLSCRPRNRARTCRSFNSRKDYGTTWQAREKSTSTC